MRGALKNPPSRSLAASTAFKTALSSVGGDTSPLLTYLNINELLSKLLHMAPENQRAMLQLISPNIPGTFISALKFDPPGVKNTAFITIERGRSPSGFDEQRFLSNSSFRVVPEDAPACMGVILDVKGLYEKISSLFASLMPPPPQMPSGSPSIQMPNPLEIVLAGASGKVGFNIKDDLLPNLNGDFIIYQLPASGLLFPDFVVAVPVKNTLKIEKCLESLTTAIETVSVRESRYKGTTIKALTARVGKGQGFGFSIYYTLTDNRLLISLSAPALKEGVYQIAWGVRSIVDTSDFIKVSSHLPSQKQYLSYRKPGRSLASLYSIGSSLLNLVANAGVQIVDPLELPRTGLFSQELFGCASACVRSHNGFLFEDFSPSGVCVVPSLENGQGVALVGMLSAIAIPNFIRARKTTQKNICINNLRMLDSAKKQYAIKNGLADGVTFPISAFTDYLKRPSKTLRCPAGGTYSDLNIVGTRPHCSVHGSPGNS